MKNNRFYLGAYLENKNLATESSSLSLVELLHARCSSFNETLLGVILRIFAKISAMLCSRTLWNIYTQSRAEFIFEEAMLHKRI